MIGRDPLNPLALHPDLFAELGRIEYDPRVNRYLLKVGVNPIGFDYMDPATVAAVVVAWELRNPNEKPYDVMAHVKAQAKSILAADPRMGKAYREYQELTKPEQAEEADKRR